MTTKKEAAAEMQKPLSDEQKAKIARNPMTDRQKETLAKSRGIPVTKRRGAVMREQSEN